MEGATGPPSPSVFPSLGAEIPAPLVAVNNGSLSYNNETLGDPYSVIIDNNTSIGFEQSGQYMLLMNIAVESDFNELGVVTPFTITPTASPPSVFIFSGQSAYVTNTVTASFYTISIPFTWFIYVPIGSTPAQIFFSFQYASLAGGDCNINQATINCYYIGAVNPI